MAQDEVNGILQGLVIAQQRRAQDLQNSQATQQLQQQKEYQAGVLKQQQDELKQKTQYEQQQIDLLKKAHALAALKEGRELGASMQQGTPIPGDTKVGEVTDEQGNTFEHHNVPGLTDEQGNPVPIIIPNRETFNKITQARKTAEEAPAIAGRVQEIETGKKADLERIEASKRADLERQQQIIAGENERARQHEQAENLRNAADQSTRLHVAKIGAGIEGTDPTLITDYVHQAINGDLTDEQIKKTIPFKGFQQAITNGVTEAGGQILTKPEQEVKQAFTPVNQIIDKMNQYNQLVRNEGQLKVNIPGTDAYKQAKLIEAEIDGVLPNVARVIATDTGRLSNTQIKLVEGMAQPSKNFLSSDAKTNEQRRDDFVDIVNKVIDSKLSRLPEAQRSAIKQKLAIPTSGRSAAPASEQTPSAQGSPTIIRYDSQGNRIQ